ncbi:MAG TPA: choice-of-anchor D domain-containing protein, partial [Casimicrobiaceae bacterium]
VMAYNTACAAAGVSCVRIPYLSNPYLTYGSPPDPLGSTATADVVRVHNQNALTVAGFRTTGGTISQPCTYVLSPTSASVGAAGGSGSTALTSGAGCAWNVSSSAAWLTVSSATSGSGSASVAYVAAANAGGARSANLSIGGQTFLVSQAAATVAPASAAVSPGAINFGTVMVGKASGAKAATVSNAGGGTLTIGSVAMGGVNPGDFVGTGTCVANLTLAAGQGCTVSVTFKPLAAGTRAAVLSIGTTAGNVGVSLSGTGKKTGRK